MRKAKECTVAVAHFAHVYFSNAVALLSMQLVRSALQRRTVLRQLMPRSLLAGCTCSSQSQAHTPLYTSIRRSSYSRTSDNADHAPLEESMIKPRAVSAAVAPSADDHRARPLIVFDLPGALPYATVWKWQQRIVRDKVAAERRMKKAAAAESQATVADEMHAAPSALDLSAGVSDVLLIVEHDSIYTLGRNSSLEHLRFPPDVTVRVAERGELSQEDAARLQASSPAPRADFELLRVERGGEVTFHGPGQIILYPLLALNPAPAAVAGLTGHTPFRADLHWFLRSLESVVIRLLSLYGIQGERLEGASGVWVRDPASPSELASATSSPSPLRKIAAMGLSCSSWVSMHGLALNVDCDMRPFDYIVPCGLTDPAKFGGVTSMQQCLQRTHAEPIMLEHSRIRQQLLECFCEEFGLPAPAAIRTQPPTWQEPIVTQ